ncbi:MAG: sigma-54 interaction domain-containing protein [Campylobacterota bacterium]
MEEKCEICLTNKELRVLYEISLLVSKTYDLETSMEKSLRILKSGLELENCVIYLLEEERLNTFASVDFTKQQKILSSFRMGEGATGLAAQSKEPVVVENVHNDILFLNKSGNRNNRTISYVAVPMLVDKDIVGVLSANLTKSTEIDFDETIRILTIISSIFGQAIYSYQMNKRENERLKDLKQYYKMEWDSKVHNFGDIIGKCEKMENVYKVIDQIADSNVTVLIRGETGTGKELVASAIHKRSSRKEEPFVKLNCAAITDSLIESELFGHEKGAFTDAKELRKGRFELADKGTLFLDEIGDISASAQVKLLRVLQEREFERVGGGKTIKVNVRLIAATNRDLEKMVQDGEFREDLYYRLNVIPIDLPPLRERGDDIKLLVNFFMEKSMKNHKKSVTLSDEAMEQLCSYPWPGNIRELENTIERTVLIGSQEGVDADQMRLLLPALEHSQLQNIRSAAPRDKTLQEIENDAITATLRECADNIPKAAERLGITQRQLRYKMQKYGL